MSLFYLVVLFCSFIHCNQKVATAIHEFNWINISFPTQQGNIDYRKNLHYTNVTMNGIKVDRMGNIYVTFPRWKANVPVTLAKYNPVTNMFDGFPSYEINNLNDSSLGLNSVLGFEIDRNNFMWVLDQSHIAGRTPSPPGSIKLMIFDLNTNPANIIRIEPFPDHIASRSSSFLNDLVIDPIKNIAYIADSGIGDEEIGFYPSIIVYDYAKNKFTRHLFQKESVMPNTTLSFSTDGHKCFTNGGMETGVDGIALTCDYTRLYYCPLTSHKVYGIETSVLLSGSEEQIEEAVVMIGDKGSVSDGLIFGSKGNLYMGNIEGNGILRSTDTQMKAFIAQKHDNHGPIPGLTQEVQGSSEMIWQDTLSIAPGVGGHEPHYLYWTTNNLCNWLNGFLDYSKVNYRIWRIKVEEKSYIEGCYKEPHHDDNDDNDSVKKKKIQVWQILLIVGCCLLLFICAVVYIGCVMVSATVVICTRKQVGDYDKL